MEQVKNENVIHGTHHYDNNGHNYIGNSVVCDASEFQVYSIEWTPYSIKWYLNGSIYFQNSIDPSSVSKEEFHSPFFLLLNLAVGGLWPGNPDSSTNFPGIMMVDYVRVYQNEFTLIESENPNQNFKIYPNPVKDVLNISKENFISYQIFTIEGKEITPSFKQQKTINVSNLDSGFYFLKIENIDGSYSKAMFVK